MESFLQAFSIVVLYGVNIILDDLPDGRFIPSFVRFLRNNQQRQLISSVAANNRFFVRMKSSSLWVTSGMLRSFYHQQVGGLTFELTRRRESKHPSPHFILHHSSFILAFAPAARVYRFVRLPNP